MGLTTEASSFLVFEGSPCAYAVEAAIVTRIVAASEWGGAPPLDVAGALGIDVPDDLTPARVLSTNSGGATLGLLVRGGIRLRELTREEVLPLPALLGGRGFSAVIAPAGHVEAVVIDVVGLIVPNGGD